MNNTREKCDCHCNWHGVFCLSPSLQWTIFSTSLYYQLSCFISHSVYMVSLYTSLWFCSHSCKNERQRATTNSIIQHRCIPYIALLICFLITFFMINIRNSTRQPFLCIWQFLCAQNTESSQRGPMPRSTSNTNPRHPVLFSMLTSEKNVAQQILGPILVSTEINLYSK